MRLIPRLRTRDRVAPNRAPTRRLGVPLPGVVPAVGLTFQSGPIYQLLADVSLPGMNAIPHNGVLDLLQKPSTLPALKATDRETTDTALPQEDFMSTRPFIQAPVRGKEKVSPFRARRFDLHLPLKYRQVGEQHWRQGTTENISRSGMLFSAEEMISPNAQLEIYLVLPVEVAGVAAEVVCRGQVVRSKRPGESRTSPALAAKILQYRFQHGSQEVQAKSA